MLCGKCNKNPAKWKVPYLWKQGKKQTQYYVCDGCRKKEEVMLKSCGKNELNGKWERV